MSLKEESADRKTYLVWATKIILILVIFPLIPLAIAFNVGGVADHLSFLPGIESGGGAVTGIVAVVYVGTVVGVAAGGGTVAMGGDVPGISNGDGPTEVTATSTQTSTATTTSTPTLSPSPPPTATISHMEARQQELKTFEAEYRSRVSGTMQNPELTGVPILATEYRKNDDNQLELWVVFWECDEVDPLTQQRLTLGNDLVNTIGAHNGPQPDRLRIYGITNLTHFENTITYIPTASAEAARNGSMSRDTYTQNWWDRQREPTQSENKTAYQMVVNESGQDTADQAFYNDHADDSMPPCSGGAEPGDEGNETPSGNTNNAVTFAPPK